MKIEFSFLKIVLYAFVPVIMLGCGSEVKHEVTAEEMGSNEEVILDYEDDDDGMNFVLPSPLQTAAIFRHSGLKYVGGITNSVENVDKYSSNLSQLMNFGVYAADLSYCVLNGQPQEAMKYMKCVKKISEELGMSTIFNSATLFESFENNIGNEDSMIYILASVQEKMDEYLEDNDQEYMQVVIFAGAWSEGMYLGTEVSKDKNSKLANRIIEQMAILDNLIKGLEYFPKKSDELNSIINDFREIQKTYKNFDAIKNLGEYDEIDFEQLHISATELTSISAQLKAIRNKIVHV